MESLQLQFPTWYLLICALAGLVFAALLYWRDRTFADQDSPIRWAMPILRFLSVFFLSALLLSPFLKMFETTVQDPIIVVARDNSSSISDAFSEGDSASLDQSWRQLGKALSGQFDVRFLRFGEEVVENDSVNYKDQVTDIARLMDHVNEQYGDQNLGAVIVATDGLYNKGRNPLYSGQRYTAPVHTVALGDTTVQTDLWIQRVLHNKISFLGDRFPVQIDISARRLEGRAANLVVEKIEGESFRTLHESSFRIDRDQFFTTEEILLNADQAGVNRYRVRVSGISGERQYANNSRDFYIEVIDGRLEILVLGHAPHPDLTAFSEILGINENYNIDVRLIDDFNARITDYDLVVFHQLPSAAHDISALLTAMDDEDIPRWFVIGQSTSIPRLNNVQEFLVLQSAGERSPNEVTAIVNKSFQLFTVPENLEQEIQTFAPLSAPYGEYIVNPAADVYMYQKIGNVDTRYPLMLFGESGSTKVGIIAAEGIWKWRLYDYLQNGTHELTNTLIGKAVQYTTVKDDRRRFRASPSRNLYMDNENIVFEAELYNQTYELVNDPEVFLTIRDSEGNDYNFTFNKTANSYSIDIGKFPVGEYRYTAVTDYTNQRQQVNGRFSVRPVQLESYVTRADHNLLQSLSSAMGGEVYYPGEIAQLGEDLLTSSEIKPVMYQNAQNQPLLQLRWIFFILVALIGLEWFLRRFLGSY